MADQGLAERIVEALSSADMDEEIREVIRRVLSEEIQIIEMQHYHIGRSEGFRAGLKRAEEIVSTTTLRLDGYAMRFSIGAAIAREAEKEAGRGDKA